MTSAQHLPSPKDPRRSSKARRFSLGLAGMMLLAPVALGGFLACSDNPGTYETTPRPVTALALNKTTLALSPGGATATLTVTVTPTDATNPAVTWSSSNAAAATVANGVVTSVGVGTATITVTSVDSGKTATCVVTVAPIAVTGVTVAPTTLSMVAGGDTATLAATVSPANATNKAVTWSSTDSGIASVLNGIVTPVAVGSATITAMTADGNKTATCAVTVSAKVILVTGVTLDQPTVALGIGGTATLAPTVAPADATNPAVTWGTSNAAVATVANGVVTAVALGSATITATTADGGFTATCDVTVNATFYGFTATGQVYSKLGLAGAWTQVNATAAGATFGLVISNDGTTFYGITNVPNGNLWQMNGVAGTWASVGTQTASGTAKAGCTDGTNFYIFTNTGKYNTKTGVAGTWNAANGTGAGMAGIVAAFINGSNFYGFQTTGELFSNPMSSAATTAWASVNANTSPAALVSVTTNGTSYFGISADGQLYQKTGDAGTWANVSTNTAGVVLVSVIYN